MYLCEVEQDKPGDRTFENMNAVNSETEPSVPPGEGSISHLHFLSSSDFYFFKENLFSTLPEWYESVNWA